MGGALTSITISLGGLVGVALLGPTSEVATLPVSTMIVGTACGTIPAAMMMGRIGRRAGFMVGALIASLGGIVAFAGIMMGLFPLYCLGTFCGGFSFAFVQQYRFAASEGASERFRPKAISFVLAGGLLAGIIGPQTVIVTRDLFAPTAFAGAYLAQALLALVSIAILTAYRAAGRPAALGGGRGRAAPATDPRRAEGAAGDPRLAGLLWRHEPHDDGCAARNAGLRAAAPTTPRSASSGTSSPCSRRASSPAI